MKIDKIEVVIQLSYQQPASMLINWLNGMLGNCFMILWDKGRNSKLNFHYQSTVEQYSLYYDVTSTTRTMIRSQ